MTSNKYIITSGFDDYTIGMWDIENRESIHRFKKEHSEWITSLAVTSDNKYIISGSYDQKIGIWNIADKKFIH